VPAYPQDPRFATRAPMIRRSVVLTEDTPSAITSLVVTVMGADRPGIVRQLSERGERFGANWTASRLSHLAGEFAGMVHFEVPRDNAEPLAASLRGLESAGLKLVIARSESAGSSAGLRSVELELIGEDRLGIVSKLTGILADAGVSIEHMNTEIVGAHEAAKKTFKVSANLLVPKALSSEELQRRLEVVGREMMLDIALGDRAAQSD
jgi:glycine cleavage system regulatory protein